MISTKFKTQLANISNVLTNKGELTGLLTSFTALDASQQKVILSSKLLTEEQKAQCLTMATLTSANTTYTAEQLTKATGISAETLANWGLISSTDTLTLSELAEMAASDAQAKKVLEKIIANNAQAVANGEVTASNATLTASEGAVTLATGTLTTAIKANISAMITWMTTTPLGWLTMIVGGVFLAVKAYDALTVSIEEQKEKMDEAVSSYEDAKSTLSETTSELETQQQEIDELLSKEKLTYAEKGQLKELKDITSELRVQKDLNEKNVSKTKKDSAIEATKLYKKQFGEYDVSEEKIDEYEHNADLAGNNVILISDENNISSMLAGYRQFVELRKQAYNDGDQYNIEHFTELTDDLRENIFETAQSLQEQKDAISDYYSSLQNTPYEKLTSGQKDVVDSYNAISSAIRLIYKELDPQSWNNIQLTDVFSVDGIEKTKDELIKMAKAGTLDENVLKSYPKLYKAIQDGNFILEDGETAAGAFCDELYAIAYSAGDTNIIKLKQQLNGYKEALEDEYKKIDEWGLGDYADKIKGGTLQSVFGNVDMDKRTIITWSDELKETYKDALDSWGYDPEIGSVDTVFGMSERFGEDLNGSGWEVAFTPILPDGTFLSKDTVNEYINTILQEAYANDGKVTEDELKEIDAQGKRIGETFVKGIFAGMDASEDYGEDGNGNKASLFGKLMHFAGKFGAIKINTKGIEDTTNALKEVEKAVDSVTASLDNFEAASDKIGKLASAYKELSDEGYITISTINEIKEATGLSGDEWTDYETKLLNAKKGSAEFNQVMSDLTYRIIENNVSVDDLANATEDEIAATEKKIAAVLRENGVINASAVAHDYVTKQKAKAVAKNFELSNSVDENKKKLAEEATACGISTAAYAQLVAQETIFNNSSLNITDKVSKLAMLQQALGKTTSAAIGLNNALVGRNTDSRLEMSVAIQQYGIKRTGTGYEYNGVTYNNASDAVNAAMMADFVKDLKVDFEIPNIDFSGLNKSPSGSSSSSDKNDALDNYLEDAERRYKIHQDETKYINDLNYALSNLAKTEVERRDILDDIEQARKDYADNRVTDIEHQIEMLQNLKGETVDVLEYYDQIQAIAHEEADRLRAYGYDDNSNEVQEWQSKWWDAQDKKMDFYSQQHEDIISGIEHARDMALAKNPYTDTTSYYKQMQDEYHKLAELYRSIDSEKYKKEIQELQQSWQDAQQAIVDWRWENSQNWINQRNAFNDWNLFDDSEIKAWERVIDWLKTEYPEALDKIREAEEALYDARQEQFDKATDLVSSYLDSKKTLLQSYYDVTNSVTEAQHEITKELEASKTIYEYLNEDTRKLLFNQEDYNVLSEELYDIQYKADKLQRQYQYDLENSTLDTIEEITSNYEMQYETLMKSYEIAKAELEVAKKRQQLDNVLNERNVRMFIDGQWQWVANTQDVIDAQGELADAEYARKTAEAEARQTTSINNLTKQQDELGTVINKFESGVITLDDAVSEVASALGSIPSMISSALSTSTTSSTTRSSSSFSTNTSNATAWVPGVGNVGVYIDSNGKTQSSLPTGSIVNTSSGSYKITGGTAGNYTSVKVDKKYASGSGNTVAGNILVGEEEPEVLVTKYGDFVPVEQPTLFKDMAAGGKVFNGAQMQNLKTLWDMSNNLMPNFDGVVNRTQNAIVNNDNSYHVYFQGVEIDNGIIDIDKLKRYIGNH